MSYQTLDVTRDPNDYRDPEFGGPEQEPMRPMDYAKRDTPESRTVYGVVQIPTTAPDPEDVTHSGSVTSQVGMNKYRMIGAGEKAIGDYNPKNSKLQPAYDMIKQSIKINDDQKRMVLNLLDSTDTLYTSNLKDPTPTRQAQIERSLNAAANSIATYEDAQFKFTFSELLDPTKFIVKTTQVVKAVLYTPEQVARAEKTINDYVSLWANTLIQKQYCDRQQRNFKTLAVAQGKSLDSPEVAAVLTGYSDASKKLMEQLYAMEPTIKNFAKSDPFFFDALNGAVIAVQSKGVVSATTKNGTQVQAKIISGDVVPAEQVGVGPVAAVVMIGIVVVGLVFAMAAVEKAYAEVITRKNNFEVNKKVLEGLAASQQRMTQAWEDEKAGKITAVQREAIVKQETTYQESLKQVQKEGVKEPATKGNIPWVPIGIGVGMLTLGWIAWKQGWIQQSAKALSGSGMAGKMMKQISAR
jgi:hypothetical protein